MPTTKHLTFDCNFAEVPVTIGEQEFVLREADGAAATQYRNAVLNSTQLTAGEVSGIKGMADVEPMLVSRCLFYQCPDDVASHDKPVPLTVVLGWPSRIQKALYDKVRQMSDIGETDEEEEAAKNEQGSTTDGSD